MKGKIWTIWKYTIGSFSDEKTAEYDNNTGIITVTTNDVHGFGLNNPTTVKLEGLELAMYSTLEKTIILKSVDMFKSIPAENLSRVAQITEEVEFEANTQIMAEGDYGDSLFIVVDGNVKIHKGDQEIVRLGKGACLGEMALLDGEPRSADATVTEDSTLFKIEQEGFYEVMGSQSEIMEGIIKLLSGKLRDTNEKLMSK